MDFWQRSFSCLTTVCCKQLRIFNSNRKRSLQQTCRLAEWSDWWIWERSAGGSSTILCKLLNICRVSRLLENLYIRYIGAHFCTHIPETSFDLMFHSLKQTIYEWQKSAESQTWFQGSAALFLVVQTIVSLQPKDMCKCQRMVLHLMTKFQKPFFAIFLSDTESWSSVRDTWRWCSCRSQVSINHRLPSITDIFGHFFSSYISCCSPVHQPQEHSRACSVAEGHFWKPWIILRVCVCV